MARTAGWQFLAALGVGMALAAQAPPDGPCGPAGQGPAWPPPQASDRGTPGPGPAARGGRPEGPPMLRFLALTGEQQKAVKAVLDRHRPALMARRKALADQDAALGASQEDPASSQAQLRALLAADSAARVDLVLEQRAVFLEIHALLTPEQQAKAERLRLKEQNERTARRELMEEIGGRRARVPDRDRSSDPRKIIKNY